MSLLGTLEDVKLADVLRLLASGRKTGVLTIADGTTRGTVRLQRGLVVHAVTGRLHGEEAIVDLFGWRAGQITFLPEEHSVTPNIGRDVDSLILEGLKRGEAFHKQRELIPNERVIFQTGAGPATDDVRHPIGRREWGILRRVDGVADVSEIVEGSELSRDDVMQVLCDLAEAGFIEKIEIRKSLRVQAQGLIGKTGVELDQRVDEEWRGFPRFEMGVLRVEVRTAEGKTAPLGVSFRPGLFRDVSVPRSVMADLGLREGEEVTVRPIA